MSLRTCSDQRKRSCQLSWRAADRFGVLHRLDRDGSVDSLPLRQRPFQPPQCQTGPTPPGPGPSILKMEDVTATAEVPVPPVSANVDAPDLGMTIAVADAAMDASGTAMPEITSNMEVAVEQQTIAPVADSEAMLVETQPQEVVLAVPGVYELPLGLGL